LASVLRHTFSSLTETEFHTVFSHVIRYGRKSILINSLVLIPLLCLIVYVARYGAQDVLFIAGTSLYVIGSFVLSRLLNEPNYTQLLACNSADTASIARLRSKLNQGNIARAALASTGVLLMGWSLL
jgi:uncharacterized membrane protein